VWLGGPVVADRSPSVLLRRAGLGIRRLLSGNDDLAVLKACQRAEQTAVLSYRQALEKSLPGPVQALLERHYRGVRLNCIRIRDLRVMHQAIGQTDYADAKNIVALRAARADDADPLHKRNRG
jgi:hypothetical protein